MADLSDVKPPSVNLKVVWTWTFFFPLMISVIMDHDFLEWVIQIFIKQN